MATEIPGQILPVVDEKKLADPIWYEWFTYLRGAVKSLVIFQTNAESAWTAYTPTLTSLAGTYTSASAAGRYSAIGKTVYVHVSITITTIGTGTYPLFTLPVAPRNGNHANFYGYDRGTSNKFVHARYSGAGSTFLASDVNNANIAASGSVFELTGVYEAV